MGRGLSVRGGAGTHMRPGKSVSLRSHVLSRSRSKSCVAAAPAAAAPAAAPTANRRVGLAMLCLECRAERTHAPRGTDGRRWQAARARRGPATASGGRCTHRFKAAPFKPCHPMNGPTPKPSGTRAVCQPQKAQSSGYRSEDWPDRTRKNDEMCVERLEPPIPASTRRLAADASRRVKTVERIPPSALNPRHPPPLDAPREGHHAEERGGRGSGAAACTPM
jgi:hypothetical protein